MFAPLTPRYRSPYETPPFVAPPFSGDPVAAALAPGLGAPLSAPEAFVWGKGGTRMTPAEVAAAREMAQRQMASGADYSPVGHWTQGLARALDGLSGGLEMRRARNADEANRAESDSVIEALLSGGSDNRTLLAAAANPFISDEARKLVGMEYARLNPKPSAPPEIVELAQIANDPRQPAHIRKAAGDRITALNDPLVNMPLPGGRAFVGPRSEVVPTLGGGGQASGAAPTASPPAEAVAELKADPSGAAEFDEVFGAGAAARVLGSGGPTHTASGGFPAGG